MRRCIDFGLMVGLLALVGASKLFAQVGDGPIAAGAAGSPPRVFRSEASVVSLGVTVTDKSQHPVSGLAQGDFAIFEDGRPQDVRFFVGDATPLDLAILLDTSMSMGPILSQVQEAAVQLAAALRPGDRASFIEVKRAMNELHPLSADTTGLARAIRATRPGGDTSLFDAIYITLRSLRGAKAANEVRRQALVLLSDGKDTSSLVKYDDVLDAVQRSGVTVYAVSLQSASEGAPPTSKKTTPMSRLLMGDTVNGDYVLRSLAEQSGGRAFFGLGSKGFAPTCQQIATELANQYALGYVSSNPRNDGGYRLVSVRIVTAAGMIARTRPGYFATSTSSRPLAAR
jgi:Ca-activated chloride channel family protein